jgi:uncharacterized protein
MLHRLIIGLLWLLPLVVQAEIAVPALTAHVTDLTGTLTVEQRSALEAKLTVFETEKGSQLSVLIVPTTQPEAIEQYSIRVVEQWKLGRKKVDDGVLLLIAKDDRKLRIEVGYGLEGALPDVIAKRIVAEDISPYFKQGDFYGGIVAGVTRLIAVIQGEKLPALQKKSADTSSSSFANYFPFILFGALVGGALLRNMLGALPGSLVNGGWVGIAVMLLSGSVIFALLLGVMAFAFALGGGRGMGLAGLGGFGGGGGGLSGGGGFSGGGGGFGGGGASGGW